MGIKDFSLFETEQFAKFYKYYFNMVCSPSKFVKLKFNFAFIANRLGAADWNKINGYTTRTNF